MLDELAGVLARLDAREIRRWRSAPLPRPRADAPTDPVLPFATMWLEPAQRSASTPRRPKEPKRIELMRDAQGRFYAQHADAHSPSLHPLQSELVLRLTESWPRFRPEDTAPRAGAPDSPHPGSTRAPAPGEPFEVPHPYVAGWHTVDEALIDERIYRDQRVRIEGMSRRLSEQTLIARLPRGEARTPLGLVVWIDPSDRGVPPGSLHRALDELHLIAVGARSMGNTTPVMDRFQLVFDAIATIERRHRIDRTRIYAVGMSGGGRASSMLWGVFPDVFAGAVPIVGLNSYKRAMVPGKGMAPAGFSRPPGHLFALLKTRRLAPMTGPPDFNHDQMQAYASGLKLDGHAVRMFVYDDMGHEMPTPDRFLDAMAWVDEPARTAALDALARARVALDRALARFGSDSPSSPEHREALVEVTRIAPWSAPALRAAEMIGPAGQ